MTDVTGVNWIMRVVALSLILAVKYVRSHSWIACADYSEKNGGYWDPEKCRGYPRESHRFAQKDSFGQDRGFDYRPGLQSPACMTRYSPASYNAEYPKAVYYPGQQVILAHPMKNHGAASCTNPHIPDFGNRIYHGNVDTDRDEVYSYYSDKLVADLGVSRTGSALTDPDAYPKPGYQNAPKFCENTDKSMGTYSFNIPKNKFTPGEYTFVWRWSFNGAGDRYTTCFDVIIVANKEARDKFLLQRNPSADLTVACGGTLSNEAPGGSEGCDGVVGPQVTTAPTTDRPVVTFGPTTTQPTTSEVQLAVNAYQITGEVDIEAPSSDSVKRRFLSVHFECPAKVSFWNARLIRMHNHGRMKRHAAIHHDLVQEEPQDVASGKVYFTASFDEPCDLLTNPPVAKHLHDEA